MDPKSNVDNSKVESGFETGPLLPSLSPKPNNSKDSEGIGRPLVLPFFFM
jgi:hypothetical protein